MKLLIAILLAVFLSGCSFTEAILPTVTQPETVQPPTEETTAPKEEYISTYLPGSSAEMTTDGAIKVYVPDVADALRLYPMGDHLLLLSGGSTSSLTVLEKETMAVCAKLDLDCLIPLETGGIWVSDSGVAYINEPQRSVVFLDENLNETKWISLPADMQGNALLSPSLDQVFYCAGSDVRAVDLRTGLTRLIKAHDTAVQSLWGVYLGGEVLHGFAEGADGNGQAVYFSSENGATLYAGKPLWQFATCEDQYLASFEDGTVRVCLTGSKEGTPQMLTLPYSTLLYPVLSEDVLVTAEVAQEETNLSCIDLTTGRRESEVTLQGSVFIADATEKDGIVYFLAELPDSENIVICRWDPAMAQTGPSQSLYCPYATAEAPDEAGLRRCAEDASKIGEKFGVEILIWEEALKHQPDDQQLEPEYQVAAYERDLQVLETALANFPEGFLKTLVLGTDNEKLTISLVRNIRGEEMLGSLEESKGIQFWVNESAYITLAMGHDLEQTLYHELSHVIDNRVFGTTLVYDAWGELNPDGFDYDYSYIANRYREDYQYLGDTDAAFIDMYSMSYPKEDRARILEYAMMPGNEAYFDAEILQTKLRVICAGIREAFELENNDAYLWEQYLQEPLTDE